MAAAFLPQFGCFARSQINALDRHERTPLVLCRSASRFSPIYGFSFEHPFDFELGNAVTVEQGWSERKGEGGKKGKRGKREWIREDGYEIMFSRDDED